MVPINSQFRYTSTGFEVPPYDINGTIAVDIGVNIAITANIVDIDTINH